MAGKVFSFFPTCSHTLRFKFRRRTFSISFLCRRCMFRSLQKTLPALDALIGYRPLVRATSEKTGKGSLAAAVFLHNPLPGLTRAIPIFSSFQVALSGFRDGKTVPSHTYLKQLVSISPVKQAHCSTTPLNLRRSPFDFCRQLVAYGWKYTGDLSYNNTHLFASAEAIEKVSLKVQYAQRKNMPVLPSRCAHLCEPTWA
jgi:hypothetical protein